ncbi:MAG: hypothetical protein ACOYJ8_01345 [Patescibacteria group bacterium]
MAKSFFTHKVSEEINLVSDWFAEEDNLEENRAFFLRSEACFSFLVFLTISLILA